jgi:hypothetical protein
MGAGEIPSPGTGGSPTLQENNPRFARALEKNRAADERALGQRQTGQTIAEIVLSMAGGGPLASQAIRRLGISGVKKAVAARAAGAGLGGMAGAATLPTQEGVTKEELFGGFVRGAAGELLGPMVRPIGRRITGTVPGKVVTKTIDKMTQPLRAPFRRGLIPEAEETIQVFKGTGTMPTPGQLVDRPILDEFEGMISASVFGGARLKGARTAAEGRATEMVRGFAERMRTTHSPEELGKLVDHALANDGKLHQRAVRGAFTSLKRRYGEAKVDVRVVNKLALRLESQLTGLRRSSAQAKAIIKDVLDEGPTDKAAQEIFPTETLRRIGRGDRINFSEAINLRSDLLTLERAAGDILPGRTQATAAGLAKVLDRRIREGLRQQYGPQAVVEWRAANQLVAIGKTGTNNRYMSELIDTAEPESIVDKVIRPGQSSRIRNVRTKVEHAIRKGKADPETWRAVQGEYLHRLLKDSSVTDPLTGIVNGQRLLNVLNDFGDEALKEVFPGGSHVQLRTLARALATSQRPEKQGFGGVAMRLAQFGALIEVVGDPMTLFGAESESGYGSGRNQMAGAILLGPAALSYVLTNPRAARHLTTGLTSIPGSITARRAFNQLVTHLDEVLPEGSAATNAPAQTELVEVPSITDLRGTQ